MPKISMQGIAYTYLILISVNSAAQDLFDLPLEDLINIKVTGPTLTVESVRTTPAAVTVFNHRQIELMGVDSIQELMHFVPGFQSYRSNKISYSHSYSSRGRRIGFQSAEILILLDGHRLAEPGTGGGGNFFGQYPLANIERIEFIRGPGSVIYGSNAMMGTINIITRRKGAFGRVQAGSNDFKGFQFSDYSFGGRANWSLHVNVEEDDGESYIFPAAIPGQELTQDPKKLLNFDGWAQLGSVELDFHYFQTKAHGFISEFGLTDDLLSEESEYISLSARHEGRLQEWKHWAGFFVNQAERSGQYVQLPQGALFSISQPASIDPLYIVGTTEPQNEYRFETRLERDLIGQSSILLGMEFRKITIDNADLISNYDLEKLYNNDIPVDYYGTIVSRSSFQESFDQNTYSVFGQYQKQASMGQLTLGVRYDKYQEVGSEISPRISWVWDFSDSNTLKLLYGRAFRAPAGNELQVGNFPLLAGNPNLSPETVDTFDLIWIYESENYQMSLGYFESHFKNAIVTVPVEGSSQLRYDNVDQDPAKGYELDVKSKLINNLLLFASATYFNELPDTSFSEAKKLGSFGINYTITDFSFDISTSYHGERQYRSRDQSLVTLNDYWLAFGKITYHMSDQFSGFIRAKNLFDKDYITPPANASLEQGVPNRGRETVLGFTLRF